MSKVKHGDFFQSESLKAPNIKNGQVFTIEEYEAVKTRLGTRPLLRFKAMKLPLFLNATNFDKMVEKFGDETGKWIGKKVRLQIVNVEMDGEPVKGIRIS